MGATPYWSTRVARLPFVSTCLLLAACNASAPPPTDPSVPQAMAPKLTKGEVFQYSNQDGALTITFEGATPNGELQFEFVYGDDPSRRIVQYDTHELGTLRQIKNGETIATWRPHSGLLDFPLYVGKAWTHSYVVDRNDRNEQHRTRYAEVKDYEKVTVPAGTFDAFRIEADNQLSTTSRPADETYWYAPAVGQVIKYTSHEWGINSILTKHTEARR